MKIRHIIVTPGVEWVEIEDAGLKILCGCPADIVKHLMRRGLIVESDVGGVAAETGPNAILISDVTLQGGEFANLGEFPVLQMLYKQGLLIPNHPNNTGQKPLLIGLADQIESQLNYIYRGNYGLISKEELLEAGVDEATATDLMRIKTHFAFGQIRPADELLDTLSLDREEQEIRNGVFIERVALNRYRIRYGEEHVVVNLNLAESEVYSSPYPLGMHHVAREYFSVIHSGEGDGWDFDRPCMSSLLSFQGKLYLIDAGPNLGAILNALSLSVNELEGIFHTHSHDDHFAGLTALLKSDHKLRYYSVPMVRAAVSKKLSALTSIKESAFGKYFDVVDLEADTWNDINGLEVMPIISPHPVENSVFRFRALGPKGYRTYTHLADITADRVLDDMVTDDDSKMGLSAAYRDKVQASYRQFANLKKIDVGGGLIHGDAEDFVDDQSDKLVLAHIAQPLTTDERQIGSGAEFGTADVLIPASQDYLRRQAHDYLESYFPDLPPNSLQILLNNEMRKHNPHEILISSGQAVDELLLIVSGNAEELQEGSTDVVRLTAGDFLGELPALQKSTANATHRATSFLHALVIPAGQYSEFIDHYIDREAVEDLARKRIWLRSTWLFSDWLSYPVHNRVANAMSMTELEDGLVVEDETNQGVLRMIDSGIIKRFVGENVLETLRSGDFFNEGRSVFGSTPKSHWQSIGTTQVWDIPTEVIEGIPIVQWKIFETFRHRIQTAHDVTTPIPELEKV